MSYRSSTASLAIAEMREFAGFTASERQFIERSLDIALGRGDAFKQWSPDGSEAGTIRKQYLAYRELRTLREAAPELHAMEGLSYYIGALVRIATQDLALEQIESFSAFRFLYERLLGASSRPYLPAVFCAAAALPQIRPGIRRVLLQSLSETAATAPGWSEREPSFYPERVVSDAA